MVEPGQRGPCGRLARWTTATTSDCSRTASWGVGRAGPTSDPGRVPSPLPWPTCSVGSEICAQAAIQCFDYLDAPPAKVTGADVPMPYAKHLEEAALPSSDRVVAAVTEMAF